jgi:hypothetical protein
MIAPLAALAALFVTAFLLARGLWAVMGAMAARIVNGERIVDAAEVKAKLYAARKWWCEFLCRHIGHDWMNVYVWGIPFGDGWSMGLRTWRIDDKGYVCLRCGETWGDVSAESRSAFIRQAQAQAKSEGHA